VEGEGVVEEEEEEEENERSGTVVTGIIGVVDSVG
jgi:hypothetical protein